MAKRVFGRARPSLTALAMTACVMTSGAAKAETIAVFTKNQVNPNYVALRLGVDKAAAAMGVHTYHRVPSQPDDPAEQIAMLAEVAKDKPNAIIFNPADVELLAPPFKAINALGIPIVNVVNRAPYADRTSFVGADDQAIGYATAKYLFEAMAGKGRILILEGPPTAVTSVARAGGFALALHEFPGIKVVASANGKNLRPDGAAQFHAMVASNGMVDGVLAANDEMALGALDALDATGGVKAVKVVGVNGVPDAIEAIAAGRMLATENYSGFLLGCLSGFAAVRQLRGLPVPTTINLPIQMIDHSNAKHFMVPLAERECPTWESLVR